MFIHEYIYICFNTLRIGQIECLFYIICECLYSSLYSQINEVLNTLIKIVMFLRVYPRISMLFGMVCKCPFLIVVQHTHCIAVINSKSPFKMPE